MRTLKQFQDEVLYPLRAQREQALWKGEQMVEDAKKKYFALKRKQEVDRLDFDKKQREALAAFVEQQRLDLRQFLNRQADERTQGYSEHQERTAEGKTMRRKANEAYQNAAGLAFEEYNKERAAAGLEPVKEAGRRKPEENTPQADGQKSPTDAALDAGQLAVADMIAKRVRKLFAGVIDKDDIRTALKPQGDGGFKVTVDISVSEGQ